MIRYPHSLASLLLPNGRLFVYRRSGTLSACQAPV